MGGAKSRDFLIYAIKKTLCVLIGGHVVEGVAEVHEDVGALLNCTKYTRQREEGLFSNIRKKKSAPDLKKNRRKTSDIILIEDYCIPLHVRRIIYENRNW